MSVPAKELEILLLEVCPYLAVMLPAELVEPVVRPPNLVAMQPPNLGAMQTPFDFDKTIVVCCHRKFDEFANA